MTTPPGIIRPPWSAAFGTQFERRLLSMIVEGSPFARSCAPLPTERGAVAFGLLDTADPAWGSELSEVPDLAKDQGQYEVAVSRLSGSILISQESIDDSDYPLTSAVGQVVIDTFSNKLDRDLIGGSGTGPVPRGILSVAAEVTAADWLQAATAAKGQIGQAGGTASHIALSPATVAQLEGAVDEIGHQLYPDAAQRFAGLTTVQAVGATQPFVYESPRCWLVVRKDFTADISRETDSAWLHYAQSLRVVGRFALAVPQPVKAVRRLAVSGARAASAKR
jgi:HK97 family phage major capsid protein